MYVVEASEVEIPAVHDIESIGMEGDCIQKVNIAHLAARHIKKRRNRAADIESKVEFESRFCGDIGRPRKEREAQLNTRGIDSIAGTLDVVSDVGLVAV